MARLQLASSTKEITWPGFRRDTMDSHFGDYNWRKIINKPLYEAFLFMVDTFYELTRCLQAQLYCEKRKMPTQTWPIMCSNIKS